MEDAAMPLRKVQRRIAQMRLTHLACISAFLFLIGNPLVSFGQLRLHTTAMDSVALTIHYYMDKEMSMPPNEDGSMEDGKEEFYPLGRCLLETSDGDRLARRLESKSAYARERALPYHYNVTVHYYRGGIMMQEVRLSTMTGNITVTKFEMEAGEAVGPDAEDYQVFADKASQGFEKYWVRLLRKYALWDKIGEGDRLDFGGK